MELLRWQPTWSDAIQANTERYLSQLAALDQRTKVLVRELVQKKQVLVTAHDAFAYFGKAYGLPVYSLQGLSTLSEPGLRDLTQLIEVIQTYKVKAIFAEQTISPKALKAVAKGAAEKNHRVVLAGPLYTDSLDAPTTPAGTYLGMFDTNLQLIYSQLLP